MRADSDQGSESDQASALTRSAGPGTPPATAGTGPGLGPDRGHPSHGPVAAVGRLLQNSLSAAIGVPWLLY